MLSNIYYFYVIVANITKYLLMLTNIGNINQYVLMFASSWGGRQGEEKNFSSRENVFLRDWRLKIEECTAGLSAILQS